MKNFTNKIDEKSAVTFAVMVVALINQALTMTGRPIIRISDDQVSSVVAVVFTIIASLSGFAMNRPLMKTKNSVKSKN